MRSLVVVVPALVAATAALVGCAQPGARALEGRAERGTTAVLAIDAAGNTFKAVPDASLQFHIDVASLAPVKVVALKGGVVQTLVFASKKGAPRIATEIPNNEGTITLGALSTCDCSGTGDPETTPSTNPLTECDSNGNGVDDFDDDNHDAGEGEGEGDAHDGGGDDGDHHDGGGDDGDHHDGEDGGDDHGGDDGNNDCGQAAGEGEGEGAVAAGEGEGEGEGEGAAEIPPQG